MTYTEPQQSSLYQTYMEKLRWRVVHIGDVQVFIRSFPLMGGMMKMHRPKKLPDISEMTSLVKTYRVRTLVVEPVLTQNEKELNEWCTAMRHHVQISSTPYLPTKTIQIDVTRDTDKIFSSLSEAKRRAVRRATALGVTVSESESIHDVLSIKNASAGLFGFMTTSGMKELWEVFAPEHASGVLAFNSQKKIIGGVLLLHYDHVTYYWIAGASKEGKKLFAPTLLGWEALKIAKARKSNIFDFVGVWDERIPNENTQWLGFTKFKEGFGGKSIYYPLVYTKLRSNSKKSV